MTEEHTLLGLLADIRAAAGDRKGRLMQPELVEHIRTLKARADQAEQLRAEIEAMKGLCVPTREDAERQQWKGMDGAIAFHLIDRHADNWNEAARMMHAWRDANLPAELAAKAGEVEALRGFAQRVMESWPHGDVDGGDLQEAAYAAGLLAPITATEPCGESCSCAEWGEWPIECYRKTDLLKGTGPWVNPLAAEVSALRRLLFQLYTVPGMGYTDDGELQDSTVHPSIDFLRMTTEQIQEAIRRREGKGGRLGDLAAEVEKLRASMSISEALDEYEARTKALPCQHEIPERGCSTYNWQMAAIRDLRAIAARKGEGPLRIAERIGARPTKKGPHPCRPSAPHLGTACCSLTRRRGCTESPGWIGARASKARPVCPPSAATASAD